MAAARSTLKSIFVFTTVFIAFAGIGAAAGVVTGYLRSAPSLDEVTFDTQMTTYIYDTRGEVIARVFREHRIPVRLEEIPLTLRQAVIATEDYRFYQHRGVDFIGIARAAWANLRGGSGLQGGSTITQQLARLAFLTLDRTWSRKLKEVLWAIQIERKYTKDEILETYLNEYYFGHGAYGVEAASQLYFGKSVRDLDLAESALLAGLLRGPYYYSPLVDMDAAKRRRNVVLSRMAEVGFISEAEAERAKRQEIVLATKREPRNRAPYFVSYVLRELLERYGDEQVYGGGLHVYTTLDLSMQEKAEAIFEEHPFLNAVTTRDDNGLRQPQVALISIEPQTGAIRAMVGGRDRDQYNRAVQALRQPGSAIKPFIYIAAIDSGLTPATLRIDAPFRWQDPYTGEIWEPRNNNRTFAGPVTLRTALEDSINIIAVKLLHEDIPVEKVAEYAERLGITTIVKEGRRNDLNLAFALGGLTRGVSVLQMAQAFAVLANQGIRVDPIAIERVVGPDGTVIDEFQARKEVVLSEQTAYLVTDMLRGVIERGTGQRARIGRPAAGKTGTTQDFTNAWFAGYTPDLVTVIWIGNDIQSQPMSYPRYGNVGSWLPAELWGRYMREVLADKPVRNFTRPHGITTGIPIDIRTGLRVPPGCNIPPGEVREEIFRAGTEPTEISPRCWDSFRDPFMPSPRS